MSDPTDVKPGTPIIDATGVTLRDLKSDEINSYIKLRDGADKAMVCAEGLSPEQIELVGVNEKTIKQLTLKIGEYRKLSKLHPASVKLTELLGESLIATGHEISQLFGEVAAQARRRGERSANSAEVLGPLQDLLDYHYGPAKKAVATRVKAKKAPPAKPGTTTPGTATPGTATPGSATPGSATPGTATPGSATPATATPATATPATATAAT